MMMIPRNICPTNLQKLPACTYESHLNSRRKKQQKTPHASVCGCDTHFKLFKNIFQYMHNINVSTHVFVPAYAFIYNGKMDCMGFKDIER